MACESCKIIVRDELQKLNVKPIRVELGEVEVKERLSQKKKVQFDRRIRKAGLELVEHKGVILIEKMKKYIREYAHSNTRPKQNLSDYLSARLKYDYTYLSNLFTITEGINITQYLAAVKVEYAKELLLLDNLKVVEVAKRLHYSSSSHFTAQFKKITGFSPSDFLQARAKKRIPLQRLNVAGSA
jgi:AraC-like DNA-binding protein